METTFYLKYRPQNFADLDSERVREELIKIFKSGRIPHAFLFCGPKGVGKTSAARIVAKAVNCQKKKFEEGKSFSDYEPCNKCESCLSITSGRSVDVLEIDAASNRGIEDIKELREKIKLAPANLRYKVYIVDEVHMLTTEAFNALLKTLEEPPKHALFILCTTDPEKLPKTIISRCMVINFKKATREELVNKLEKIVENEKLEYEKEALIEIAKVSEGSFRDANKILEQVSYSGKITKEEVLKVVGLSFQFDIDDFLSLLEKREVKKALLWLDNVYQSGVNLKILTENILDNLRQRLLEFFGIKSESEKRDLSFSPVEIKRLIDLFTQAYFGLRNAPIPQLPLEVAVIEWDSNSRGNDDGITVCLKEKDNKKEKVQDNETKLKKIGEENDEPREGVESLLLEDLQKKWSDILEKVKPLNHSVLAFLKAARPFKCSGDFVVLEVYYKFHKDQLEKETSRRIFEKAASEVLGRKIMLKCQLSEGKKHDGEDNHLTSNLPVNYESDIIEFAEKIFNKEEGGGHD